MGLFDFVRNAGEKIFGGKAELDEQAIRKHILDQGLALKPFNVVASPDGTVSLIGYAKTIEDKEKAIITAGNINGVAKVDDRIKIGEPASAAAAPEAVDANQTVEASEAPQARFYTVVSGDTLSKIAKQMYGNANLYPKIFEANKPMLTHPDKIYPGQVLRIPE
ncbi:peptidoglycan-binding protein LysM [Sinimarinibacterium sp. NLF-5-8]|uniref:peptidoglycan-binding protein LysM n=1 Tax=Sinimarinibacterium sp. NLF-5-8 TaxID=2698684 RepID=UPI00137BA6EF|nr:peptidoglycan-binding protein LysM [Sinimarinibacterium sp. NLF-5-8]QHS09275.1 peptidoglycan-binding protein LysM [Sinimarinibacterium sp. NLF-5-8]